MKQDRFARLRPMAIGALPSLALAAAFVAALLSSGVPAAALAGDEDAPAPRPPATRPTTRPAKPPATKPSEPTSKPAAEVTLKGACFFGGGKGAFTAKLKPTSGQMYSVVYSVVWNGQPSTYKGTIKTDLKTTIVGDGSSGGATFEFSGRFVNGVARCSYSEKGVRGGGRSGTLTISK